MVGGVAAAAAAGSAGAGAAAPPIHMLVGDVGGGVLVIHEMRK